MYFLSCFINQSYIYYKARRACHRERCLVTALWSAADWLVLSNRLGTFISIRRHFWRHWREVKSNVKKWNRCRRCSAAGLLPKRKHKFCSSERNIFFVLWARFRFMNRLQQHRGGAWNDEDKSAPGFFIIQRIIISCSRMAKGGIHPRIGLQSVTGYLFIIILLVLIRQIRGHYTDVLHHHERQCSHQHPKPHEVRSDYYTCIICDFTNFVHAWGNFLLKMVMPHVTKNITRQSTQITK